MGYQRRGHGDSHLVTHGSPHTMADELARLERWLLKTEDKLEGGKIQRPGSIVDACQALSKAKALREEIVKREKPLQIARDLVGLEDPEVKSLTKKCEGVKKVAELYLSKVEALCVLWASGQLNSDLNVIEKALKASGSKVSMTNEDLQACVSEIQAVLVV